jgi:putative Mn2+ efflux pump MntP
MGITSVILIAIGLSLDNTAIAFAGGCGKTQPTTGQMLRVALSFSIAHIIMIGAGWLGGDVLSAAADRVAPFLAAGILFFIGFKNIKDFFTKKEGDEGHGESLLFTSPKTLLLAAAATSLDALAVGISLGIAGGVSFWLMAAMLFIFVFLCSMLGFKIGGRAGAAMGGKTSIVSGVILIAVGAKILLEALK